LQDGAGVSRAVLLLRTVQKKRRLCDKIAPIEQRNNDWLRLTGDDQRKFKASDGALQCVDFCWWR
jgi:hypothetical protein